MNVTVEILSRPNVDQPYTTLVAAAVLTAAGSSFGFTPVLPPGQDAADLRLRIQSADALSIDVGFGIDPANPPQPSPIMINGVQTGTNPAPAPTTRGTFVAWAGGSRDIAFGCHEAFLIRRVGAAT